jgi:hypothetical protein
MVDFTAKVDEVFYDILDTFGKQSYDEMLSFFQTKKEKETAKRWFEEVKHYKYGLNIVFEDDSIYIKGHDNKMCDKKYVKKAMTFLRFLFTLKDENDRLQYFHTIEYADLNIEFPDVMIIKINDVWANIQYCASNNVEIYNEKIKENRKLSQNENYPVNTILITEPDIDIDKIEVKNLMNIVSIDNDNKVVVLK